MIKHILNIIFSYSHMNSSIVSEYHKLYFASGGRVISKETYNVMYNWRMYYTEFQYIYDRHMHNVADLPMQYL